MSVSADCNAKKAASSGFRGHLLIPIRMAVGYCTGNCDHLLRYWSDIGGSAVTQGYLLETPLPWVRRGFVFNGCH